MWSIHEMERSFIFFHHSIRHPYWFSALNEFKYNKNLGNECQKNEDLEFRPMREWGQRSRQDREFEEMIGGNEGPDSDEDDCHDLYPWLKNGENDSGKQINFTREINLSLEILHSPK